MKHISLHCATILLAGSVWLCISALTATAQRRTIDSLLEELHRRMLTQQEFVAILNNLSFVYNPYKADSALFYAEQALRIAERAQYTQGVADACRNLGFAYQRIGKLADATKYYLRAVPLFEKLNDTLGLANVWNGLGICYFEQGDYENALHFYQRAESMFLSIRRLDRYAAALSNIGYTYLQLGNINLAKFYAEKALALAERHNVPIIQIFALSHLGDIARRQKKYDESERWFQKGLELVRVTPANTVATSRLYYLLGFLYTDIGRFDEARQFLDSSLALSMRGNMRFRIKDAYEGYRHLYETTKNYELAYKYQSLAALYKDSLFNQESARQIAAMQRELESREKEAQIALLEKDNEVQQVTRNALLGIVAVVVIAIIFVGRAYFNIRAVNRQLALQNEQILEQRAKLEQQTNEITAINEELERKNRHLLELNEEKSQFMRIAAHDLKNPLTGISGLSEYLMIQGKQLSQEEITLLAERIHAMSQRMFQLVKNLLDVNAIESGNITLERVPVDIIPIVETSVQSYMNAAKAKNITLSLCVIGKPSAHGEFQLCAMADEQAVYQIIDNLVSNAVKYTIPGKRVSVRVLREDFLHRTNNTEQCDHSFIRMEVHDEGPGLTPQDKALLFGKFVRLSARPTGGEDSTGLGLSIVKQLVEMMQGQVWCESEYGAGATFIVRLPSAEPAYEYNI